MNELEPPSMNADTGDVAIHSNPSVGGKQSFFSRLSKSIRNLRGSNEHQRLRDTLEDYLEDYSEPLDEKELGIASNERAMMSNILKLNELTAEDVAVPRVDIVAIDVSTSFDGILKIFQEEQHSRLPVYQDTLDDILGFLHIKDVLAHLDKRDDFVLADILHTPLIVSPAMQVSMLLLRMRLNRVHLALVVDEYGGIDGLVTIEDLVEQIVGEIEDEHDEDDSPQLVEQKDHWLADARVTIEDFEDVFGNVLTDDERESDIDTLGGLVMSLAGSVPTPGQVLLHDHSGLEFRITSADPRRVIGMVVNKSQKLKSADEKLKPEKTHDSRNLDDKSLTDNSGQTVKRK
ncbi:MAG: hemolysin family protein [Alphaproteobacteria bacterium]